MDEFLELVFDVPLDRRFTYRNDPLRPARLGCRVEAQFGSRKMVGCVVAAVELPPEGLAPERIKPILKRVDQEPLFGQEHVALARWMADTYYSSEGESLCGILPGGRRESEFPSTGLDEVDINATALELSDEQGAALHAIVDSPEPHHYLYGITGSGKTEVFLHAASDSLERGLGVIYLVPEIALTGQVMDAVRARFGDKAAVLHSGLTPSQKLSEWRRIQSGQASVVVGARSAIFAPLPSLGLVVIDEEHEGSYKSGSSPRYHARQVAMRRVSLSRAAGLPARLVMGSATPSVEAWALMAQGRIVRHRLSRRLAGGELPELRVVSMRGQGTCLSAELVKEMRDCKSAGRQSILFLNRRGFSHFFHCNSCEHDLTCRNCSVGLTLHKERGRMVCHYCGYQAPVPSACPECGSLDVGYAGFGTEAVEEEVARLFPDCSIARLDADSTRKKGELERLIAEFRAGKIDILLGTQMVAKGLNFPGLRLVGVVMADTALHLPDFRAAERAFSLIVQVAGRAGRHEAGGRVIIQTLRPDNPAILLAARSDLEAFYAWELENRREAGFPPFSRMVRFVFRSRDRARTVAASDDFARRARDVLPPEAECLGPAECPVAMVSLNHRRQLIFRASSYASLHGPLRALWDSWEAPPGVYVEADADPVSLL